MSPRLIVDLTDEQVRRLGDWQECAAARIVPFGAGIAELQLTDDLERITRPEATS